MSDRICQWCKSNPLPKFAQRYCHECRGIALNAKEARGARERRAKDPSYRLRIMNNDPKLYRASAAMAHMRRMSKRMGYPFDTTKEYLMKLMQHEYCPCCGRRLDYSFGRKHMEKDSPSFDKIVPQRGYVTSNIGLLCHDCNYRKQNSTLEQLKQIVAWMESFLGRKDDADATDL